MTIFSFTPGTPRQLETEPDAAPTETDKGYKNPDNDPRGAWKSSDRFSVGTSTAPGQICRLLHLADV